MKSSLSLSALVATLALAGMSTSAHADSKGVSVLSCVPANPAQAGDLSISMNGVKNNSNGARRVNCPLPRDEESSIAEGVPTRVAPWFKIGPAAAGSISCTVYHGSLINGFTTTTLSSGSRAADTYDSLSIDVVSTPDAWNQVQMSVSCNLAPGVTLAHIYFNEGGATQ